MAVARIVFDSCLVVVARTQRHVNVRPTAAVNNTALRLGSSVCQLTQRRRSELSSLYSMQLFSLFFWSVLFHLESQTVDTLSSLLFF